MLTTRLPLAGSWVAVFLILFFPNIKPIQAAETQKVVLGVVTKISDGDTVHIQPNGQKKIKVRMIGMDTPETQLPTSGGIVSQGYWGEAAHQMLELILPLGARVQLIIYGYDKYGRALGKIVHEGENINLMMAQSGWAVPYIICDVGGCGKNYVNYFEVQAYLTACKEARRKGRGIFDPKRPLRELPFEFRLRMMDRTPDKFIGDIETKGLFHPEDYKKVDVCQRVFFMDAGDAEDLGFEFARTHSALSSPTGHLF